MADWFLRICNRSLLLLQRVLYRPFHEPHHILIFRTGSLGDSICALPAIKSILHFFPDASVDVLTNTGGRGLVGLHHLLPSTSYREVISYEGYSRIQLFRLLKKRHYDLVIQLPQVDAPFLSLVRDAFFFRGVSKSGFGWQKSQIPLFRRTQFRHLQFQNEVSRLNTLLSAHSITVLPHEVILEPMEKEYTAVREFLHSNGLTHSQQLVAIVPGAKRPQNRWPLSYFDQLIEKLSIDYNIILIGSEQDKTLSGMLTTRPNVYDACGVFTPMESAAMLRLCRLTISNDTGPMHLSYSVGTPTLALFSSRDLPGKWSPAGEANEVLRGMHVPCEACFTETCQNNICMQSISVDTVYHKAMEMLSRR